MERVQVNYDPTPENLNVTAKAGRLMQQAPQVDYNSSGFNRLMKSFADHYPELHALQVQSQDILKKQAIDYASRFDDDEFNQAVQDKKIFENQHPIFVAQVRSENGHRIMQQYARDLKAKISRGEISYENEHDAGFKIEQGADELVHNLTPEEQAGFYKEWNAYRTDIIGTYKGLENDKFRDQARGVVQGFLTDGIKAGKDINELWSEANRRWLKTMRPDDLKAVMQQTIQNLTESGMPEKIDEIKNLKYGKISLRELLGVGAYKGAYESAVNKDKQNIMEEIEGYIGELQHYFMQDPSKIDPDTAKAQIDKLEAVAHKLSEKYPELAPRFHGQIQHYTTMWQNLQSAKESEEKIRAATRDGKYQLLLDKGMSEEKAKAIVYDEIESNKKLSDGQKIQLYAKNGVEPPWIDAVKTLPAVFGGIGIDKKTDLAILDENTKSLLNHGVMLYRYNPSLAKQVLDERTFDRVAAISEQMSQGVNPSNAVTSTMNMGNAKALPHKDYILEGLKTTYDNTDMSYVLGKMAIAGLIDDPNISKESALAKIEDAVRNRCWWVNGVMFMKSDLPNLSGTTYTEPLKQFSRDIAIKNGLYDGNYMIAPDPRGTGGFVLMDMQSKDFPVPVSNPNTGGMLTISYKDLDTYLRNKGWQSPRQSIADVKKTNMAYAASGHSYDDGTYNLKEDKVGQVINDIEDYRSAKGKRSAVDEGLNRLSDVDFYALDNRDVSQFQTDIQTGKLDKVLSSYTGNFYNAEEVISFVYKKTGKYKKAYDKIKSILN